MKSGLQTSAGITLLLGRANKRNTFLGFKPQDISIFCLAGILPQKEKMTPEPLGCRSWQSRGGIFCFFRPSSQNQHLWLEVASARVCSNPCPCGPCHQQQLRDRKCISAREPRPSPEGSQKCPRICASQSHKNPACAWRFDDRICW